MTIETGDQLPEANFFVLGDAGPEQKSVQDIFSGKKVILFAVPGAYTPTCHQQHLPSFIEHGDTLKDREIEQIVCVAVNDPFVLSQWGKDVGATDKVLLLSDPEATFTTQMGLDFDGSGFGLGVRSKRYAMFVEDRMIKWMSVEEDPGAMERTSAKHVLDAL